jgi:hypothetical protein
MKATPTTRPDRVLLLQPWSTAVSQKKKKMMATTPSGFSHIMDDLDAIRVPRRGAHGKV